MLYNTYIDIHNDKNKIHYFLSLKTLHSNQVSTRNTITNTFGDEWPTLFRPKVTRESDKSLKIKCLIFVSGFHQVHTGICFLLCASIIVHLVICQQLFYINAFGLRCAYILHSLIQNRVIFTWMNLVSHTNHIS